MRKCRKDILCMQFENKRLSINILAMCGYIEMVYVYANTAQSLKQIRF